MKKEIKIKFNGLQGSGKTKLMERISFFIEHNKIGTVIIDENKHTLVVALNDK